MWTVFARYAIPRWEQAGYFIRENPYIQVIGLSK
jgi:hypothetical protein